MILFNLNHILNKLFKIQFLNVRVETHICFLMVYDCPEKQGSYSFNLRSLTVYPVRQYIREVLSRLLELEFCRAFVQNSVLPFTIYVATTIYLSSCCLQFLIFLSTPSLQAYCVG